MFVWSALLPVLLLLLAGNPAVASCGENTCDACVETGCVWDVHTVACVENEYSVAPCTAPTTPSAAPSGSPSAIPSAAPSAAPSGSPSAIPSAAPTTAPSMATVPSGSPSAAPAMATVINDPHFFTAHGDRFDFKGRNNTFYNLVSHTNITVNSLFLHADFKTHGAKKLIHGSFMRAAFVAILTNTSRKLRVGYSANSSLSASVGIDHSQQKLAAGQVLHIDDADISLQDRTLSVRTPEWLVVVTSKVMPGIVGATTCATGRCIVNVQIKPLFDVDHAKVAPHGLIGQSWDGDDVAVHGTTDDYSRKEVTTMAMGEGSIEGVAEQYEMPSGFATDFAFSRFGSTSASPRNVSALSGTKVKRSTSAVVVD